MATAYMKAGDFEKAEKLYKETMQKCIAAGRSTDDESVIELSIKLASLYAGTSQDDKAEAGFKYCVEVMDKAVAREGGLLEADTNTLALQGLAVQSYARFQTKKKNYEEGIKLFKKSLDIAREVYGADHPQALVVLNDLSSAYVVSKNYRLGIESYKEAVERAERKGNMEDSLVAFNYNLAQASILSQEFEAATSFCNRCLELANNLKNPSLVKAAEQCLADVKEAVDQKSKEKT
ncbi:tetratricopeptide repeat protein 19, mitochondrial-like [Watersipora subatra]|uniref:tetratricopeptide repeat protein 19, mitochondrial-like n=1 Tax=Watersipora subatra TaxID=2589382 RepID=UPI00355C060D